MGSFFFFFFFFEDCKTLTIPHGKVTLKHTAHGTVTTILCDEGFSLSVAPSITCSNGSWGEELPACNKGIYSIITLLYIFWLKDGISSLPKKSQNSRSVLQDGPRFYVIVLEGISFSCTPDKDIRGLYLD